MSVPEKGWFLFFFRRDSPDNFLKFFEQQRGLPGDVWRNQPCWSLHSLNRSFSRPGHGRAAQNKPFRPFVPWLFSNHFVWVHKPKSFLKKRVQLPVLSTRKRHDLDSNADRASACRCSWHTTCTCTRQWSSKLLLPTQFAVQNWPGLLFPEIATLCWWPNGVFFYHRFYTM